MSMEYTFIMSVNMREILIFLGLGLFIWVVVVQMMNGSVMDESASVSVYPDPSNTKNYELEGTVEKITKSPKILLSESSYSIERFTWPNGGYAEFTDCSVLELNTMVTCETDSGDTYGIEIHTFEPPESDYDTSY
jgi:hypothetical protein